MEGDVCVRASEERQEVQVDEVDRQLLALLASNARVSVTELAARVKRSRTSIYERIDRLEKTGLIAGYTVIRGDALPSRPPLRAYMMLKLTGPVCARVAPVLELIPEVRRSQSISGQIDMILYVEAASMDDMCAVRERIEKIHGVNEVTTLPILTDRFDRT